MRYVCDSDREVLSGVSPENGTIICNEICDVIAYQEQNILQPADCELLPFLCTFVYVFVCVCVRACVRACVYRSATCVIRVHVYTYVSILFL